MTLTCECQISQIHHRLNFLCCWVWSMRKAFLSLNSVRNFPGQLASVTYRWLSGLLSANRNNFHFIDEGTVALRRNDFLLYSPREILSPQMKENWGLQSLLCHSKKYSRHDVGLDSCLHQCPIHKERQQRETVSAPGVALIKTHPEAETNTWKTQLKIKLQSLTILFYVIKVSYLAMWIYNT